jgi:exopolyphosphatase/pppGpp-phosphohydrolase
MMDVGVIDVGSHTVRLLLAHRDDERIQPLRQE